MIECFLIKVAVQLIIDSMGRLLTQTRGRAFQALGQAFQTLGRAFDFILSGQKLGRMFRKFSQVVEKLGRVFWNKYSAECFVKESFKKSGQ